MVRATQPPKLNPVFRQQAARRGNRDKSKINETAFSARLGLAASRLGDSTASNQGGLSVLMDAPKYITQDDSEIDVIFIHSKLDDVGLTANQFRIFAHLSRRAHSAGKAWPGIDSMAKVCRMHKETVIVTIRQLEEFCMIVAERKPGKSTIYRLTAPSKWVVGKGERSERGNAPVGTGERHQSERGNERKSIEETPKKEAAGAAAHSESSIKSKVVKVYLPPELDTDEFVAAWDRWTADRRSRRIKPYTIQGAQGQLKRIAQWGAQRAIAAIDYSITQQHQGIYEEKNNATQANQSNRNSGTFNAGTASKFAGREKLA